MMKNGINAHFDDGLQFICGNYKSGKTGLQRCIKEAKEIQAQTGGVKVFIYQENTYEKLPRFIWIYFNRCVPLVERFECIGYITNGSFIKNLTSLIRDV